MDTPATPVNDPPADPRLRDAASTFRAQQDLDRLISGPQPGSGDAVGDRVARFLPPGVSTSDLLPSLALQRPLVPSGTKVDFLRTSPRFGITRDGRWATVFDVEAGTSLYGLGMHAGALERTGRRIICWNTDFPGYTDNNPSLYQSHPWVMGVRRDGSAFGILADTTWRTTIDLPGGAGGIRFFAEGVPHAVYVIERDEPGSVVRALAHMTGFMPMPPRWALGYQQCRWSYYPQGRVLRIAEEFRRRSIPLDAIWMDIHYMHEYQIFTTHPQRFPDPKSLSDRLHAIGVKGVWMIDPAPKVADGYAVHDTGMAGDHFVLDQKGQPYQGECWPGKVCYPDFTRPETRAWWGDLYRTMIDWGIDGVWNDMNEPSNFADASGTLSESAWHRGGEGLPAGPHALYHNAYGMLMARATREGLERLQPDRRHFVLTRSNYLGGQRYAATWTADNSATWRDLRWSITMILNLGLSGQPFVGPDIGGFIDDSEGDPELFARWMGIGCLFPFARAHVAEGSIDKEPWSFGEACETTCRRAIERRYRLLPYLYTVFRESARDGLPITRPAFFVDPTDESLRECEHAFLLGGDLLAVCDIWGPEECDKRTPCDLPAACADWARVDHLIDAHPDEALPKLYIRPGAVLPIGPVMLWHDERTVDPLALIAAPDSDSNAIGLLYEDEGDGHAYQHGDYRLTRFALRSDGRGREIRGERIEGERLFPQREVSGVLADANGSPLAVRL